ncbi:MAG: nucleotidyltransferase family protein [Thermoanaerobaculia bacterium]
MTTARMLPWELWPLACRAATGKTWPPASQAAADRLVAFASHHKLLPLLAATAPDSNLLARALERSRALLRVNHVWAETWIETMKTFRGVVGDEEFILFKGADFAFRLYDQLELRPMADIDVLVPAAATQRLRARMEAAGFTPQYPKPACRDAAHHEFGFRSTGVTIEIHQTFIQRPRHRIDYEAVWARREPLRTPAGTAFRLADRDALLALCIAVAGDYFDPPLIRLLDLHLLLLQNDSALDDQTTALARAWKCERAVYGTLRRYQRLFPESAPPHLARTLRSLLAPRSRAFLEATVLPADLPTGKVRRRRMKELWQKFWTMDDSRRRVAFLLYHLVSTAKGHLEILRERRLSPRGHSEPQKAR